MGRINANVHEGKAYEVEIVLCSNAKVLFEAAGPDPTGNGWKNETAFAVDAADSVIDDHLGGYADRDEHLQHWSGEGRFGSQARMHNYERLGYMVARVFVCDRDEDREPCGDWRSIPYADAPGLIREHIERAAEACGRVILASIERAKVGV